MGQVDDVLCAVPLVLSGRYFFVHQEQLSLKKQ